MLITMNRARAFDSEAAEVFCVVAVCSVGAEDFCCCAAAKLPPQMIDMRATNAQVAFGFLFWSATIRRIVLPFPSHRKKKHYGDQMASYSI
jgi:hypothetical protein